MFIEPKIQTVYRYTLNAPPLSHSKQHIQFILKTKTMKTFKFLFVAALLTASTTLMAQTHARTFGESIAIRQTEHMVNQLDLSKTQAHKILAINQDFFFNDSLLFLQRRELLQLGYVDATVEQTFRETRTKDMDARNQAIKSLLNNEQLVAYETILPEVSRAMREPRRVMHERVRDDS